jgi:mannose-6-phosphate isomerase-like protein (cupin superfamily)
MASIVRVDENELPWADYTGVAPGLVRFKTIAGRGDAAPPTTFVEYAPGHEDGVHSHDEGEVFVITAGEVTVGETVNGPGTIVYIPSGVEYSMRSGDDGVRFFRIVVP